MSRAKLTSDAGSGDQSKFPWNWNKIDADRQKVEGYEGLRREELIRLLLERDAAEAGALRLTYTGQKSRAIAPQWVV